MKSMLRGQQRYSGSWSDNLNNLRIQVEQFKRFSSIRNSNAYPSHTVIPRYNVQPQLLIKCEFCGKAFTEKQMEDEHNGNCPQEIVWCEYKCGVKMNRKYLDDHMTDECCKRTVRCQFCDKEFVQETLQTHQFQCPSYPIMCPNSCERSRVTRGDLDVHLQDDCPSAIVSCPFSEAGCGYTGPRYSLENHLTKNTTTHLSLTWSLVHKQQQQINQLVALVQTSTNLTNGTFIWKIPNFKQKLYDAAQSLTKQELNSQTFYTRHCGYKMMASVFPNGNASGEGNYLSVYIKLLPGEYDNILDWPFSLPISVTLYDQVDESDGRSNIIDSFQPDPSWKHFQKPVSDKETLGFGYPKFVSHDVLKSRGYTKDDCLIIGISVEV